MKMSRQIVALLMMAAILLITASCGKKNNDTSSSISELSSEASSQVSSVTSSSVASESKSQSSSSTVSQTGTTKFTLPKVTLKNKKIKYYVGMGDTLEKYRSTVKGLPTGLDLFEQKYGGEVELINVSWDEYYTKLYASYLANDMPDLLWFMPDQFPVAISKSLIQSVDQYSPYIDLSSEIWDDTRQYTDKLRLNGKAYYPVIDTGKVNMLMYNPKLFELADIETPLQVYKRNPNEWNWDKMLEMAKALTVQKDGQIVQYGLAIAGDGAQSFQESTGVPFVEYLPGQGVNNNLKSPSIADAANFVRDLGPTKYNVLDPALSHESNREFILGKAAMVTDFSWRTTSDYKNLWKAGKIEAVPFPRYPKLTQQNVFYGGNVLVSTMLSSKAKNPEAACLFLTLGKYASNTAAYNSDYKVNSNGLKYKISDRLGISREQYDLIKAVDTDRTKFPFVVNQWVGFYGDGWYCGFKDLNTKTWATILEEFYPKAQNALQENYNKVKNFAG